MWTRSRIRRRGLSLEHQAFDMAGVGMAYIKGDRFVRVNDAFARLVGYPASRIRGASFFDFVPGEDLEQKRADFENLLREGRAQVRFDESYFHSDGSRIWVTLTATRIRSDEADRLIVAHDITSRVAAEQMVREERDKLDGVLSSMSEAVFFCHTTSNFIEFNRAFLDFHRLTEGPEAYQRLDQIAGLFEAYELSGELLAFEQWPVSRALRGETGTDYQLRIRRRDTGEAWFGSFNYAPRTDGSGAIVGGIVVARDVTQRILADRQLQAERDKLKAALLSMPDAVYIGNGVDDPDINDAFAAFLRFPDRDHTIRQLAGYHQVLELRTLAGELVSFDQWPIARAMRGEVGVGEQFQFHRTDIDESWFVSSNFAPIRTPDGAIAGCAVIMRDITEAKRAEDALRASREKLEAMVEERTKSLAEAKQEADRANAAKTRFLAAASHDLRQPLQAAKVYLGVLERVPPGEPTAPILAGLETSLSVMTGLLGTMLDMSRLQAGFVKPQPTVFALDTLLDQIVRASLPAAEGKGLEVRTELEPCLVSTDRALLLSAVHNLLSNAVKYTEHGFVAVRCRVADGCAAIEIEDSGIGISPEDRSAIFQEYVQLANPARNPEHGVGLGLSLVKSSLELLGITLRLDSRVEHGTLFAFDLPCVSMPEAAAPVPAAAHGSDTNAVTVLVVEDDAAVRESFVTLLELCGHRSHGVATRAEALAFVESGAAFDVMMTDYRLPDGFGTDVIREARQLYGNDFPAIVITGDTQLDGTGAFDIANCQVMSKPVKVPVVMDLLTQLGRQPVARVHDPV